MADKVVVVAIVAIVCMVIATMYAIKKITEKTKLWKGIPYKLTKRYTLFFIAYNQLLSRDWL